MRLPGTPTTARSAPPNALDRVMEYLAPGVALRRAAARSAMLQLRRYEGASRSRRTKGWLTSGASANQETQTSLAMLRNRSRDLVRNNSWANKAVRVLKARHIGTGLVANPRGSKAEVRELDKVWADWTLDGDCSLDGQLTMAGLQQQVLGCLVESGEVLVRRVPERNLRPIPLRLQVLEPDHLDIGRNESLRGGGVILQGVEFDRLGRRVAYWLYPEHPGELLTRKAFQSKRVRASEVLHIYRVDRPGQVRGVPWGAPCLLRLRDFDEFLDAHLLRQKIAACFVAFRVDLEATPSPQPTLTADGELEEPEQDLRPGSIVDTAAGRHWEFANPPQTHGLADYSRVSLHEVAAGFGVSYEALVGDLRGVSFSAGRMGGLDFQALVDLDRAGTVVPQFCRRVWRWFLDFGELAGTVKTRLRADWIPPPRPLINPREEIRASVDKVTAGLGALDDEARSVSGRPLADVVEQLAQDRDLLEEAGLTVASVLAAPRGA